MEPTPGQELGHYRVERKIGQGGMGSVHLATDVRLDRQVAIKVLTSELTADEERRLRFQQEAVLAAALNHPNIATVHDVGEESGATYIVMEYVRGKSLRELISSEPLEVERVVEIAEGIGAGLARAHREGVLHRDLKPDNVVLTGAGVPKILDFGLGKLLGDRAAPRPSPDSAPATEFEALPEPIVSELPTMTLEGSPYVTREGQILGTLAYMSPEQVQGRAVDARSDVFSFGALLYEMLAGERPFAGESKLDTVSAILRSDPTPVAQARQGVPGELEEILGRCLTKEPDERFASGEELHEALAELKRRLETPEAGLAALLRRPPVLIAAGLAVALAVAGIVWFGQKSAKVSWARNEVLPEIERLIGEGDEDAAMRLVREASAIIPEDPYLQEYMYSVGIPTFIGSEPAGATVFVKGYNYPDRKWIRVGETPLEEVVVAQPTRFRIEKEGYVPLEAAPVGGAVNFRLFREEEIPPGMVYVAAGSAEFGTAPPVPLDEFWIDQHEVTNREYKAFVDAGGYREDRFWDAEADRSSFVDTTGRPGPAGWALGGYGEGEDDLPVGGVTWYEARAYAAWTGKSLPTVFHWRHAAQQGIFSEILRWSNFDTEGTAPVGSYDGLGPFGTYDMAGNVREWCLNRTGSGHYILGGAWSDPDYLYRNADATEPDNRLLINGFRLIKTDAELTAESLAAVENPVWDHRQDVPFDDETFAHIPQNFAYDQRELGVEEVSSAVEESWRHEVVSIDSAYGDERFLIHLYFPKDGEPPYQGVVYWPPTSAIFLRDSNRPSFPMGYIIPKSGRALIFPIYQGTYGRQVEVRGPNDWREVVIQRVKDLRRTLDYLETRADIAADKLAFYGLSWGAFMGPIVTAIESRFASSILLAGGAWHAPEGWPAMGVPQNYAPHVSVPTLMINGENDFGAPIETNIRPLFDMLGTPDEHKRLVILEGGHVPAKPNEVIRAVLDWLDEYLGPVDTSG